MAAEKIRFKKFTCGLDTSYSSKSPDTIAMMFQGITEDRKLITLAEKVYSNEDLGSATCTIRYSCKVYRFPGKMPQRTGDLQKIRLLTVQMQQQSQNCGSISDCTAVFIISWNHTRK